MKKDMKLHAYKLMKEARKQYGTFHKCLFHIHTPVSYDYGLYEKNKGKSDYSSMTVDEIFRIAQDESLFFPNNELDDIIYDDTFFTDKKEFIAFLLIAHKLTTNKIKIAVITDHNTIAGFSKLEKAFEIYEKQRSIICTHIFLGIEISCADKIHVVGVFDSKKQNMFDSINKWLNKCIMSEKDGTYYTSFQVLSEIEQLGGIGYITHLDTSDVFKDSKFLNNLYKKKLFSINPLIIGLSDISKRKMASDKIKDYSKMEPMYLWDCDSHGIDSLNSKVLWVKGQSPNFDMLRNAIRDFDIAIRFQEPQEPKQFISGLYIDGSDGNFLMSAPQNRVESKSFHVNFSDSLNCFIGGRGTGKSTVLNIMNFALGQYLPSERKKGCDILESICKHSIVHICYRYESSDYIVTFLPPVKESPSDDILKSFGPVFYDTKHRWRIQYNNREIANHAIKRCLEVYKVIEANNKTEFEKVRENNKQNLLKIFFRKGYSINELVNIAGSQELGEYIFSILFENKALSKPSTKKPSSLNGLLKYISTMEDFSSNRSHSVRSIIDSFNEKQRDKLRITYMRNGNSEADLRFEDFFSDKNKSFYRNYNITIASLVSYLDYLASHMDIIHLIEYIAKDLYKSADVNHSIMDFCDEMTMGLVNKNIVEINQGNVDEFHELLKQELFSHQNIITWVESLNNWIIKSEVFGLEFNVNNSENSQPKKPLFKKVNELSLGQKVVAMLSFILGYSDYSDDFTPLIIDQPEDNLDNQYIHRNLVKDLREIKDKRQVIIATHNSTIVTNAKAEQVIVMQSDNKHGWVQKTGYPTDTAIVKTIIDHLEGGVDSFNHKLFIYDKAIKSVGRL